RRERVDAVVDTAPQQREGRLLDEGDVVLGDPLAALDPVVVEPDVSRVAILDELPGGGVGRPDQVLRLRVARALQRPEPERGAGVSRRHTQPAGDEPGEDDQPRAAVRHAPQPGARACAASESIITVVPPRIAGSEPEAEKGHAGYRSRRAMDLGTSVENRP